MPAPANPMTALYARLAAVGLPHKFVRDTVLPEWWDDEIALNATGLAEGHTYLARYLGLDPASLRDPVGPVRLREFGPCKFKKPAGVADDQFALCRTLALRVAQIAGSAVTTAPRPLPGAADIRDAVLAAGGCWVGLAELLDFCWSAGVPVLHLDRFPAGARRPDGFAANVGGRPVVVLCKKARHPAWLLFILAHELGHLALGHVPEGGSLFDGKFETKPEDAEEQEADQFALELLTGTPPQRFTATGRWPNAADLAALARETGLARQIDPGHVVLNYARHMGAANSGGFYAVANAALKLLDPRANAVRTVRDAMAARLDWGQLPVETCEFLTRVAKDGPGDDLPC